MHLHQVATKLVEVFREGETVTIDLEGDHQLGGQTLRLLLVWIAAIIRYFPEYRIVVRVSKVFEYFNNSKKEALNSFVQLFPQKASLDYSQEDFLFVLLVEPDAKETFAPAKKLRTSGATFLVTQWLVPVLLLFEFYGTLSIRGYTFISRAPGDMSGESNWSDQFPGATVTANIVPSIYGSRQTETVIHISHGQPPQPPPYTSDSATVYCLEGNEDGAAGVVGLVKEVIPGCGVVVQPLRPSPYIRKNVMCVVVTLNGKTGAFDDDGLEQSLIGWVNTIYSDGITMYDADKELIARLQPGCSLPFRTVVKDGEIAYCHVQKLVNFLNMLATQDGVHPFRSRVDHVGDSTFNFIWSDRVKKVC